MDRGELAGGEQVVERPSADGEEPDSVRQGDEAEVVVEVGGHLVVDVRGPIRRPARSSSPRPRSDEAHLVSVHRARSSAEPVRAAERWSTWGSESLELAVCSARIGSSSLQISA